MKKTFKQMLCLALTAAMLCAVLMTAASAGGYSGLGFSHLAELALEDEELVNAIVVLEEGAVIDAALYGSDADAMRERLLKGQSLLINKLDEGIEVEARFTDLVNGFSVVATVAQLKEIEQWNRVSGVYVSNRYVMQELDEAETSANASYASRITGASAAQSLGYYGDGIVIAVLGTGMKLTHEAFKPNAFMKDPALSYLDVTTQKGLLLVSPGEYVSEKIPFSYDYANKRANAKDSLGIGTHLASVAAGYVKNTLYGAAPAAQILNMKVSEDGGTDSVTVLSALEDAYRLGADVITIPFGLPSGLAYDSALENRVFRELYKKLRGEGVAVFCCAGDSGTLIDNNTSIYALAGYPVEAIPGLIADYGTVNSPSTYPQSISVASADNLVQNLGFFIRLEDDGALYAASDPNHASAKMSFMASFGGKKTDFVLIGGFGAPEDYRGFSKKMLFGKIVVVKRGGKLTFEQKIVNAEKAGAAGIIIVNDSETMVEMDVKNSPIPAVLVTQEAGEKLKELAGAKTPLAIETGYALKDVETGLLISETSAMGPASDLSFKPQITGIGGSVYAAAPDSDISYTVASGTGIAAANAAGTFALLLEHAGDILGIFSTKAERLQLAEQLMYSTSNILYNEDGYAYSPRSQGTGLLSAINALTASAVITNPTQSLGSIAVKGDETDGTVTMSFRVTGLAKKTKTYKVFYQTVMDEFVIAGGLEYYGLYNTGKPDDPNRRFGDVVSAAIRAVHKGGRTEEDGTLTLKPGETVTLEVNIQLNPELVQELYDYLTMTGFFFDGFVSLYDAEELEAAEESGETPRETCHGAFISFLGDWENIPSMELSSTHYIADLLGSRSYVRTYGPEYLIYDIETVTTPNIVLNTATDGELYYPGINLYTNTMSSSFCSSSFISFSTPETNADEYLLDGLYMEPSLLRSLDELAMVVTDYHTDEVYYEDVRKYVSKNILDPKTGKYTRSSQFSWDGRRNDGTLIPSGTMVRITYYTTLQYGDKLAYPEMEFYATVDYTAPEMQLAFDAETGTLAIRATDNSRLASIGMMYNDQVASVAIPGYQNIPAVVTTSLKTLIDQGLDSITIRVADYASNVVYRTISLKETFSEIPVSVVVTETEGADVIAPETAMLYEYFPVAVDVKEDYCPTDDYTVSAIHTNTQKATVKFDREFNDVDYFLVKPININNLTVSVRGVEEHDFQPVHIVLPTCCDQGVDEYRCTRCGKVDHLEDVEALGHDYESEYTVIQSKTCKEGSIEIQYCSRCGEILDIRTEDPSDHVADEETEVISEPTCVTPGYTAVHCKFCGVVIEVLTVPPTGHTAAEDTKTVTAPTCVDGGFDAVYCKDCGYVMELIPVAATGHTPGEPVVTVEPDYTVSGECVTYCAVCGALLKAEAIPAYGLPDGDVNLDGEVNVADYLAIKAYVLGLIDLTDEQKRHADVDYDHKVTAFDYFRIKYFVLHDDEKDPLIDKETK